MSSEQTTFFSDLPKPEDEQFRARQLDVFNWGTLSGLHRISIPAGGLLMTGPSGAGKSTLLDAIAIMLTPPANLRMNAAAQNSNKGDADRSLHSYVRGAWSTSGDEHQTEGRKEYLREGATWSALTLRFENKTGRVITLVRLFWLTGAQANAELHKHYLVVEGTFDLAESFKGFDGDLRKLKKQLAFEHIRSHDTFEAYRENWCRTMGVTSADALVLLHRTCSTKNLDTLDGFMRDFMLERPETFALAERLVSEFSDLDEAHRAVMSARHQIEILTPARDHYAARTQSLSEIERLTAIKGNVDGFISHTEMNLLNQSCDRMRTRLQAAKGEHTTAREKAAQAEAEWQQLQVKYLKAGGSDINEVKQRLDDARNRRDEVMTRRTKLAIHAQQFGLNLASSSAEYADQVDVARAYQREAAQQRESREAERNRLIGEKNTVESNVGDLRKEVARLEAYPSNIPDRNQSIRDRMSDALNIPLSKLPFVGELLQVKPDEAPWAGAIERLLHGFALTMLVPEPEARRIARWVDEHNLRGKLAYRPVGGERESSPREPSIDSVLAKLDRKDHPYAPWLHRQLADRFNYSCVRNVADLEKGDYRLTIAGQIRHNKGLREKDDRQAIDQRSHWVLGFDSREKLQHLRDALTKASESLITIKDALSAINATAQSEILKLPAATALMETDWTTIDAVAAADAVRALEQRVAGLLGGNAELANLEGSVKCADITRKALDVNARDLLSEIRALEASIEKQELRLGSARVNAGAVTVSQVKAVRDRLPPEWSPALDELPTVARQLDQALAADIASLRLHASSLGNKMEMAFRDFLTTWPAEAGSLQATLACADAFFLKLAKVEADGLPVHETRFRELLRTQSHERLAELNRRLSQSFRDITGRLEDINDALRPIDYFPGTYLQIKAIDLRLADAVEFRRRLAEQFTRQASAESDPTVAEAQFLDLKALVDDLRSDDAGRRSWRELVLDVRRHYGFVAFEYERGTDRGLFRHEGTSGQSGGQRQKLTTTCLAAALRYKLGGVDGGVASFGLVTLDEAFSGADHLFTKTCMEVFTQLGFQVLLATPLKSVMAIEPFVEGALHVSIRNRNRTQLLPIGYDHVRQRLDLPHSLAKTFTKAANEAT